jgi:hypothetical protein
LFESIDPYLRDIERGMKLPDGVTGRQLIPEIIARILEVPVELLATDVTGAKIAEFIGGALLVGLPGFIGPALSDKWTKRDTEDIFAIGKQWLIEATDPSVDDIVKIANAIQNLRMGITFGDPSRIRLAFGVKSPSDISSDISRVTSAWAAALGLGPPMRTKSSPAAGATAPLYKETLSGSTSMAKPPTAPITTPTGALQAFRLTLDHNQPAAATVTPRYRLTLTG